LHNGIRTATNIANVAFLMFFMGCEGFVCPCGKMRRSYLFAYKGFSKAQQNCFCSLQAFKVIREEKLSAALFAPGWVMETQGTEHFIANQDK